MNRRCRLALFVRLGRWPRRMAAAFSSTNSNNRPHPIARVAGSRSRCGDAWVVVAARWGAVLFPGPGEPAGLAPVASWFPQEQGRSSVDPLFIHFHRLMRESTSRDCPCRHASWREKKRRSVALKSRVHSESRNLLIIVLRLSELISAAPTVPAVPGSPRSRTRLRDIYEKELA